jgi:hypothetical protein
MKQSVKEEMIDRCYITLVRLGNLSVDEALRLAQRIYPTEEAAIKVKHRAKGGF